MAVTSEVRSPKAVRRGAPGAAFTTGDSSPARLLRSTQRSVAGRGGSTPWPVGGVTAPGSKGGLRLGRRRMAPYRGGVAEADDVSEGGTAGRPAGIGSALTRGRRRRSGRGAGLPEEILPGFAQRGGGGGSL
jgi:hypothetical protein